MELRHLKYFVAVAEQKSFRRAAERLRISQPPLSMQIRQLEEELGVTLFERTSRSVRLNPAAQNVLQIAHTILAQARHLATAAQQAAAGEGGTLSLGYLPSALGPLLARVLRSFTAAHPHVQLSLVEQRIPQQLEAVLSGVLDVGMMHGEPEQPELTAEVIRESTVTLALPRHHRLARQEKIRLKSLRGERLVLLRPELARGFYDPFLAACSAAGVFLPVAHYTNDFATKLWLVSAGFGVSPTMTPIENLFGRNLVYRQVAADLPKWKLSLVYRKANPSAALRRFLEEVRKLKQV
jgi:DNA-binding transcriptional LysR family regulator